MKGSIRPRGAGSFEIRVYIGRDGKNRPRYASKTVNGSKREAQREAAKMIVARETGALIEPSKLTVNDWLEKWLGVIASSVARKTHERYAEIVRKHLVPGLGHHPLAKLAPMHIQDHYTKTLVSGRRVKKGRPDGLSARTVLHHHRILFQAMRQAVKMRMLAINPCDAVEPPKPNRHEAHFLDHEHAAKAIKASQGTILEMPVLLALATGMRRGEVLGLRWSDVDLDQNSMTINQSLEETGATLVFKAPKTAKSRRRLAVPPMAIEAMRAHRARQAAQRLRLGAIWQDYGLVCCADDGRPLRPRNVTKQFSALAKKHRLGVRFHDLRHTHVSHMIAAGAHAKTISERAGHSSIAITMDLYGHMMAGQDQAAADAVGDALAKALAKKE